MICQNQTLINVTNKHLKHCLKTAAHLEQLINEDVDTRCFDFNSSWDDEVELARYNNGCGDEFFVLFHQGGALIKGFDHESPMSPYSNHEGTTWPGMYQGLPKELMELLNDTSLMKSDATFCHWLEAGHNIWQQSEIQTKDHDDGAEWLLQMIPFNVNMFKKWAAAYYEEDAQQVSQSQLETAYQADHTERLSQVFYCTYQNDEHTEGGQPLSLCDKEIKRICAQVISSDENFIGFEDEDGITIQFFNEGQGIMSIDIPVVSKKGSHVNTITTDEFMILVNQLSPPYIKYIDTLDLEFKPW